VGLQGDGPIALIMAPTRELVQQIGKEARRFMKPLGLSCTCIYGGSGVANQVPPPQQPAPLQLHAPLRSARCRLSSGRQATIPGVWHGAGAAGLQDSTGCKATVSFTCRSRS
jgi:DEAD/DEAH box helicase